MQYLIFSDLHLQEHPVFTEVKRDDKNIFTSIALSCVEQIREYAFDHGQIQHIVHAGDLFDLKTRIPVRLISYLQAEFLDSHAIGTMFHLLRGTHDGLAEDFNARLFPFENVVAYAFPSVVPVQGVDLCLVPYGLISEMRAGIEQIRKESSAKEKHLILHAGLEGAKIGQYEDHSKNVLGRLDLRGFDYIFSGHYHKHQQIFKNAWQIGSCYPVDFAERGEQKGFIHYNNGQVKFIPFDVPKMIQFDQPVNLNVSDKELESIRGNFVKFVLTGAREKIKVFDQLAWRDYLIKAGALGVRFEFSPLEDSTKKFKPRVKKGFTHESLIDLYIKDQEPVLGDLSSRRLKSIALNALKSVKTDVKNPLQPTTSLDLRGLKRVDFENIQSFKGKHSLDVQPGVFVIRGFNKDDEGSNSNYSGKTSLLNTIPICLYGHTPLIAKGLDYVNENESVASSILTFAGASISRSVGQGLLIQVDGKEVNQDRLDQMLGLNFEGFLAVVFFGTGYYNFLGQILRKPADARDFLASLLPELSVFDLAHDWVKGQITDVENKIASLEKRIQYLTGAIETDKLVNYDSQIKQWEERHRERLDILEVSKQRIKEQLQYFEGSILPVKQLEKVIEQLKSVQAQEEGTKIRIRALDNKSNFSNGSVVELERNLKIKLAELDIIHTEKVCPECRRPLPKFLQAAEQKQAQIIVINDSLLEHKNTVHSVALRRQKYNTELNDLVKRIVEYQDVLAKAQQASDLVVQIEQSDQKILEVKKEICPYIDNVKETQERIKKNDQEKTDTEFSVKSFQEILSYFYFWERGFGTKGIKNYVLDDIVYQLSDVAQEYINELTNGAISLLLEPRKAKKTSPGFTEGINVTISGPKGPRSYYTFSDGARNRMALAVDLALNQVLRNAFGSPFDFVVFDETFDGLDRVGKDRFCRLLIRKQREGYWRTVFVISHDEDVQEAFDDQINVVKENQCSYIDGQMVVLKRRKDNLEVFLKRRQK